MITGSDITHLSYTSDLTGGGIAFTCRSLACSYDLSGASSFARLRQSVAEVVVALALRRFLGEQGIPFEVHSATPFTNPGCYDLSLGGHRCEVKSYLISRREQITLLRRDPALLLQAPALVPLDQFLADGRKNSDLYLFAFLLALTTFSQDDLDKALTAYQPAYLIYPMPKKWARPAFWYPLGELVLKSECEQSIQVDLGGQDAERNFITATYVLPPRTRVPVTQAFFTLAYIHAARQPEARLGVSCSVHGQPCLVVPGQWGNIWIYGMSILLAGYLTHEEFHRRAISIPAGHRTFQYERTAARSLAVPLNELRPPGDLFERVRAWAAAKIVNRD